MLYAKLIGGAAVMLIIYLGYTFVTNLQEDNATLTANVGKLQLANDILSAEKLKFESDIEKSKERIMEVHKKFDEAVESKNAVIRLFADHDFTNLAKRKPGLITKRMQKATAKIFREIEDVSHAQ